MHAEVVQPSGWVQYMIPVVVVAIVLSFRIRRMSQERPLKLEQLWIVPAIYLVMVAATFIAAPPSMAGWAAAIVALAIGAAIGWQRGKAMRITVDPVTHRLNQRASPLAMLILVALIAVKLLSREEGARLHLDAALITDALFAFALGLFAATRLEMYVRGKRLLAQVAGSPAA